MRATSLLDLRVLFGVFVLFALAGCAATRPYPPLICNMHNGTEARVIVSSQQVGSEDKIRPVPGRHSEESGSVTSLQALIGRNLTERSAIKRGSTSAAVVEPQGLTRPAPTPGYSKSTPSYNVLALSAGGQFGAYGSGFLKGWGERNDLRPNRADIDMITGVSTGAMMATYAYLGASDNSAVRAKYDALLKDQYTTLSNEDVFRVRSPIELPFVYSLFDSTPLRKRIAGLITEDLLNDVIAEESQTKRLLLVGAVNVNSGDFEYFDLVAIAKDASHDRRACYVAAILASAAIPIAFNPVFINDQMYVDGGARKHVFFLTELAKLAPDTTKNVYGILHGDLEVPHDKQVSGLVGLASRTSAIASDQLMLDSAYFVDAEAKRLKINVGWTAAMQSSCGAGGNDDMFSPAVGNCLWEIGLKRAREDADPWKSLEYWTRSEP